MSGWLYLLSILSFCIPIGLFFYIAIEISLRDRTVLNKLSSLLFHTIAIFFTSSLLVNLTPAPHVEIVTIWLKLVPAFFLMSFAIHLTIRMTARFQHWSTRRVVLLGYLPAFCSIALMIPSPKVSVVFTERGPWKDSLLSPEAFLFIIIPALYTLFACVFFLYQGMTYVRRCGQPQKRKQARLLLQAYIYGGLSCIGLAYFNRFMMVSGDFNYPEPSTLGLILFALMIRYAMTRYEFLPSIERRYKVLYERSPISIVLLNHSGRIMEANPAAEALFGLHRQILLQARFDELVTPYQGEARTSGGNGLELQLTLSLGKKQRIVMVERERIESGGESFEYLLVHDMTDSIKAQESITFMAYHDPLTGLGNRRRFQESLAELLQQAQQDGEWVGVLLMDLDRFKHINDTRGHHVGDLLLQHVSSVLLQTAASARLIARLGGDEFALIYKGRCEEAAEAGCRGILEGLQTPFIYEQESFSISASIGVCLSPLYGSNPEQLLQYADMAMYEAKRGGRGQFFIFSDELKREQERYHSLDERIAAALEAGQFVLYFQPQMDLATGDIWGVEALARWIEGDGTVTPPAEFIPLAEETGSIVPLGRWVLEQACRTGRAWLDEGRPELPISVNVSNKELAGEEYMRTLDAILAATGFPPQLLQLEMTESVTIAEEEHQLQLFGEIADRGIQLAMDDFGTGYSTFSVIQSMPFQIFKIDKSLIDGIGSSPKVRNIVKAMIVMAHSLDQRVVAEGVETAEQVEELRKLGCDAVQGYFYSRPLPEGELLKWIDSRNPGDLQP